MNFSVQNNSLSRSVVVSQWLFGSTGRVPSIDRHFFNASSAKLIRFGRAHALARVALALGPQDLNHDPHDRIANLAPKEIGINIEASPGVE
jgi:hypothetical protein